MNIWLNNKLENKNISYHRYWRVLHGYISAYRSQIIPGVHPAIFPFIPPGVIKDAHNKIPLGIGTRMMPMIWW